MPQHSADSVVVNVPVYYKGRIQRYKKYSFPASGAPLIKLLIDTGEIENIDLDAPDAHVKLAEYAEKLNKELVKRDSNQKLDKN